MYREQGAGSAGGWNAQHLLGWFFEMRSLEWPEIRRWLGKLSIAQVRSDYAGCNPFEGPLSWVQFAGIRCFVTYAGNVVDNIGSTQLGRLLA